MSKNSYGLFPKDSGYDFTKPKFQCPKCHKFIYLELGAWYFLASCGCKVTPEYFLEKSNE